MPGYHNGKASLRGGDNGNSNCGLIVALIIAVVVVAILLCVLLVPTSSAPSASMSGMARFGKSMKKSPGKPTKRGSKKSPGRGVRAGTGSPGGAYAAQWPAQQGGRAPPGHAGAVMNPAAVRHHAPAAQASAPAPLPAMQLMAPTKIHPPADSLHPVSSSSHEVGENDMVQSSTGAGGVVASAYADTSYTQDPGMMTTSSTTDIQGIETFMPNMSGGVGGSNGPVDPSTGLPLFTTGKLVRSQLLGGHGAGSFLRQEQDPLAGYKRIGKNMCGAQNARRDLATRREQYNAARLADPNGDPVLFNTSDFMYY